MPLLLQGQSDRGEALGRLAAVESLRI